MIAVWCDSAGKRRRVLPDSIMKVFCQRSAFMRWHLGTFPVPGDSVTINYESTTSYKTQQYDSISVCVSPHCSRWPTMARILMRSCENDNVFLILLLLCALDVFVMMKDFLKYLDGTIYCAPAATLCETPSSTQWILGFSLEWPNCTTLQCSQGTDDYANEKISWLQKLPVTGGPHCQDNKVSDQNFCSGLSSDLLCSYLQSSSSSVCFHFHSCPQHPAHFPCRQLWRHNKLLCIDSGWITRF